MPDIFNSTKAPKKKPLKAKPVKKKKKKAKRHRKNKSILDVPKGAKRHKLPGHGNPLSSYYYYPDKVKFINEDPEEKVILLLRKHPLTNLGWILIALAMIVVPGFVSVFPFFAALPLGYQLVLGTIWYMITAAFVFEEFLSWFFQVNIITDERIIEVDFHNLIYREMTDANIDQIQDVTVQIGGALRTSLEYGDIVIQTSAEIPQITFESVPRPDDVAKILRQLRVEEEIEKLEGRVR